jgi:hypothetical protein
LRAIWPDAKFIHIYRNPYLVFPSTRHFFTRILPELALQPYDNLSIDVIEQAILKSYPLMLNSLLGDSADLPADSFVEIRFEDLEKEPLAQIEKIYNQLQLPDLKISMPRFEKYIASLQGYKKNNYPQNQKAIELVKILRSGCHLFNVGIIFSHQSSVIVRHQLSVIIHNS